MAQHHIVQDKYLKQWQNEENQLNIFSISENKYLERGSKWKGFSRNDFNILDDKENRYLPETMTAQIDTPAIEVIKNLNINETIQLLGKERIVLAHYIALQYIRTPRHREEMDKIIEKTINHFRRKDISSLEKVQFKKEDILKEKPKNKQEEEALEKISKMSEEEIQKEIFESIHSDEIKMKLSNEGHSKNLFKVDKYAKELFSYEWNFLLAPKGTSFITSDNPCFVISSHKMMGGLFSPFSTVIFPLTPNICVYIKPKTKSHGENFVKLDKTLIRTINKMIAQNSYQYIIAKDKIHLQKIVKNFDHLNHKKTRDAVVYENGDYILFNIE